MMKILIPSLNMFLFKKMEMNLIIFPFMMITITMKLFNNMMLMNNFYFLDTLSSMMSLLTMISVLLIMLSSNSLKEIYMYITLILIILMMTFTTNNILYFYILFELVLIPTMILIMKSGKQPERLQAGIYLIMYTITASLPLLISILLMQNNISFNLMYISIMKFKLTLFLMLAFLVKMPMFFSHLWLPKAHVEAPLEGSMILAAILLKLGGYGLIRIFPLSIYNINSFTPWMMSISMLGASATSLNCVRQKDLKSLIAYSSVAHMALVLSSLYTLNSIGLMGAIIMMIAHGMSSSALFLLVNDLYMKIHSRNILILKGLMIISPNISFWWFMFMSVNISAPPSINTISEIFIMSSMMLWNKSLIIPIIMVSIMVTSFSLSMFINIYHNKNSMKSFILTPQKIFLSLFIHLILLIIILMKMEMFIM